MVGRNRSAIPAAERLSLAPATLSFHLKELVGAGLIASGQDGRFIYYSADYEQMAALADDPDIKKVLLDIAREEKTHVGEFETMLLRFDAEQVKEQEHARKEIKELTGK